VPSKSFTLTHRRRQPPPPSINTHGHHSIHIDPRQDSGHSKELNGFGHRTEFTIDPRKGHSSTTQDLERLVVVAAVVS
jgi:hypothetical protein